MPITEAAWKKGMVELTLLPSAEEDQAESAFRGSIYQREIQPRLNDNQWRHAVSEAIRNERWFPSVAALMAYGLACPAEPTSAAWSLPPGAVVRRPSLFSSADQEEMLGAIVHENPPRPGEGLLPYLDRIAVASALIKPGEGLIDKQDLKGNGV